MEYNLDANAGQHADHLFRKMEETGQYHSALTRAEQVVSKKGSKGVDLSFKTETGATADYLSIWTHNNEGKQLQGFNTLMAIMTCLRVKNLKAELGEVEKYDQATQQRAKVQVLLFKELMNKPLGLLIHMEEYEKTAGGTAWKPAISAPFDKDGFPASEILTKAQSATTLGKMEQGLRDRPLKNKPAQSSDNGFSDSQYSDPLGGDDLPFN